jgi:NADPH:quinone reductase-like Zn-dependent oxidoreductase
VGARVIGTGRADDRDVALGLGAQTFLDLDADHLQHVGEVDVVFDVIGRDILERSTELMRPGGTLVTIAMPPTVQPKNGKIHLLRRRTRPRPARRSFRSRRCRPSGRQDRSGFTAERESRGRRTRAVPDGRVLPERPGHA